MLEVSFSRYSPPQVKILLVEDDAVSQFLVQRYLEKFGYTVVCVEDGQKALEALEKDRFECVLMDIRMPGMDGLEATRRIRHTDSPAIDSDIPIIALTGYAMKGDRERFLDAGMNAYLSKPIELGELAGAIVRFVLEPKSLGPWNNQKAQVVFR